jgi:hypothetical protein
VEEALYDVLVTYIGPGDRVLLPVPTYPAYATIVAMCGGQAVPLILSPDDGFAFDEAALDAALPGMRALLLCNPSNPLGTLLSADSVRMVPRPPQARRELIATKSTATVLRERGQSFAGQRPSSCWAALSKSHGMNGCGWAGRGAPELIAPVINAHQYVARAPRAFAAHGAARPGAGRRCGGGALRAALAANLALLLESRAACVHARRRSPRPSYCCAAGSPACTRLLQAVSFLPRRGVRVARVGYGCRTE